MTTKVSNQLRISTNLKHRLRELPAPMGKSVIRAIKAVEQQPELLVQAFRYRLYADIEPIENLESLGINIEADLMQSVKTLAKTTRLSEQEVTRLCLEAYVYNL